MPRISACAQGRKGTFFRYFFFFFGGGGGEDGNFGGFGTISFCVGVGRGFGMAR